MGDKDKVHVKVKGTVVDGSTEIIAEDFEEWESLADVSITFGDKVVGYSDFRGIFGLSVMVEAPGELGIGFSKAGFNPKTVGIPVIQENKSQDHNLMVKMFPQSTIA